MATHSSIPFRKNLMDRGPWRAMANGVSELDTAEATQHANTVRTSLFRVLITCIFNNSLIKIICPFEKHSSLKPIISFLPKCLSAHMQWELSGTLQGKAFREWYIMVLQLWVEKKKKRYRNQNQEIRKPSMKKGREMPLVSAATDKGSLAQRKFLSTDRSIDSDAEKVELCVN